MPARPGGMDSARRSGSRACPMYDADMKALLALADGTVFHGSAFGAEGEATGEVVFNTALSGYQEILTDPSYTGQIVTMTCPEIGNVGVNPEDVESRRPCVEGFVVKEYWSRPSSWRAEQSLAAYMAEHAIVGIQGIDTRALVRHIRDHGAQQAVISTVETEPQRLVARARAAPGVLRRRRAPAASAAPRGAVRACRRSRTRSSASSGA